jgi:serine acetyltransferase
VILAHSVSLGEGIDPVTRAVGGPNIEEFVHIAPGAILIGPITIGARSKIMPGAVVLTSVPPDSLVESPPCRIGPRAGRAVSAPPRVPEAPVAAPAPPPLGGG